MNNNYYVPALAVGITALVVAASPSRAATCSLSGAVVGTMTGNSYLWMDNLTLTDSTSQWLNGYEYESTDGGTAVKVRDVAHAVSPPGTFTASIPVDQPASGHKIDTFFMNVVSYVPAPGRILYVAPVTNVGSATEANGLLHISW